MTLEEFVRDPARSAWIRYGTLKVYVRKSWRSVGDGTLFHVIDVANITNVRRPMNTARRVRPRRTGQLRAFDDAVRRVAQAHGFDGVFWENVLNEFLPDVLIRYGYAPCNERCFIWACAEGSAAAAD